jgi:hypothetical protein
VKVRRHLARREISLSVRRDWNAKVQHSRRNVVKMGASAMAYAAATFATIKSGVAGNNQGENNNNQGHASCFLRGTTILTADGGRRVEDLAVGDWLPTMFGGLRPIQWIACYPFKKSDPSKPWLDRVRPVRIARSALAPNIPRADLYVTQGHSLFIDEVLVKVGSLINGITITLDAARELSELEYFHVKLESHDVIFAEWAPCDTLLEVSETAVNFAEYLRRYGAPRGADLPCAPILSYWKRGSRFTSRFRSAVSPWIDRREQIDVIRDGLEERAVLLSRQLESSS